MRYVVKKLHPRGGYSMDTTEEYVEILSMTVFHKHYQFIQDSQNGRKKVLKHQVDVSVGINLVYGDITK